jgi:dihydrolipoamide dehydrogenase
MYDLVVIGAGPGGYEAAAHAGSLGKKVALVEEKWVGGTCLNVGCIPAKAFLRSSRLYRECGEAKLFGVEVGSYHFDLPTVVERKKRIVATLVRGVEGLLKRTGVEVVAAHGRIVGRGHVEAGDRVLETANVLVATGSRSFTPPISGIASERVLDSSSVFELAQVPSRVAIIGGGYIGLEFATFFSEVGAEVVVLEMLPKVASGCDGEVSERLLQALKRAGITVKLSCQVVGIEDGSVRYLDHAGLSKSYTADCVLNATGRTPVVEGVGLEEAGVDFSPKGIRINEQGKTNVPWIWACGDVTGQHMLAHVATREGIVAVNAMFGQPDRTRYDAIPAVIYTHPEVASAGRTEEELRAAGIAYKKAIVPMAVAGRFLIENEKGAGFVKVLAGARHGEILGAHAMGDSASEFIVAAAALIEAGLSTARAGQVVFPHPTVSEALREAIRQTNEELKEHDEVTSH